jgi:serralysin
MSWSDPLVSASQDHVLDIGPLGLLSHQGSDKSSYKDRIERYCQWGGSIFEAIDYGQSDSAREVVLSWLVDDGVPKRQHRNNLLGADNRWLGVASGPHKVTGWCSVALFAAQIVVKDQHREIAEFEGIE